jgi:replicative DNA helicase
MTTSDQLKSKFLRHLIDTDGNLPTEYSKRTYGSEVTTAWFFSYDPKSNTFNRDTPHALLFDFCLSFWDMFGKPPTDDTVAMELDSKSDLSIFVKNKVFEVLNEVRQFNHRPADFEYLKGELKSSYLRAQSIHLSHGFADRLAADPQEAIKYMMGQLTELTTRTSVTRSMDSESIWLSQMATMYRDKLFQDDSFMSGVVQYPFDLWNNKLGGMKRGELIVFAARHNVGKSFLGHEIAFSAAEKGMRVVSAELEMLYDQIALRWAARLVKLPSKKIELGRLEEWETDLLDEALLEISNNPKDNRLLFVPGLRCATPLMLKREIEQHYGDDKPDLILVDYLTKMRSSRSKHADPWESVQYVTEELKDMAMYFQCPVLTMVHLNRKNDVQYQSIEQRADIIIHLEMDENDPYLPASNSDNDWVGKPGTMNCYFERNRNGPKDFTMQLEVEWATSMVRQKSVLGNNNISGAAIGHRRSFADTEEDYDG